MTPDDIAAVLDIAPLTDAEETLLLDLARDVAHASERRYAPLTCFLVGAALHHTEGDRVAQLQRLADQVRSRLS